MIALLDYGAGNIRSVQKALERAGAQVQLVRDPGQLRGAAAAVLPGVGAFDDCIHSMQRQELFHAALQFIQTGKPFLGICVGYQALFERSEEFNSCAAGLGLFTGRVVRFAGGHLKVPHIGWNQVEVLRPGCPVLKGIESGAYFYFVHSYFPQPQDPTLALTRTTYGATFASAIWKDNVFATQFHPEKSQQTGLRLLENFVALSRG